MVSMGEILDDIRDREPCAFSDIVEESRSSSETKKKLMDLIKVDFILLSVNEKEIEDQELSWKFRKDNDEK